LAELAAGEIRNRVVLQDERLDRAGPTGAAIAVAAAAAKVPVVDGHPSDDRAARDGCLEHDVAGVDDEGRREFLEEPGPCRGRIPGQRDDRRVAPKHAAPSGGEGGGPRRVAGDIDRRIAELGELVSLWRDVPAADDDAVGAASNLTRQVRLMKILADATTCAPAASLTAGWRNFRR